VLDISINRIVTASRHWHLGSALRGAAQQRR